jgi:hypothetical protein
MKLTPRGDGCVCVQKPFLSLLNSKMRRKAFEFEQSDLDFWYLDAIV